MPKVDLIATKDFGYNTRRLMAGDAFQARNAVDAMILTRVRKVAEAPKAKPAANKIISGESVYIADKNLPSADIEKVPEAPKPAAKKKAPAKRKAKK